MQRRRFRQVDPLNKRLSDDAESSGKKPEAPHPGWCATGLFAGRGFWKPPPT